MVVEPARHLFTADEYERMGELGLFPPDQRLELLDGEIVEMTPIGPPHAGIVNRLNRWFDRGVGDRGLVTVQNPLRASDLSEPQPDLLVLRPRDDFYGSAHPRVADVLILIEVSDSTAGFDRRVKRPMYARAGIAEVWIIDVGARLVEIATDPAGDGYGRVVQLTPGQPAVPSAFPDLALPVADLFI